ncbi:MAG: ABC transporter ATP-binding protein [Bacteroidota bacterium]
MKTFFRILRYVKPYWGYIVLNLLFNVLYAIFSVISIVLVAPFLQVLFKMTKTATVAPVITMDLHSLKDFLYYEVGRIVDTRGSLEALLFISVVFIVFSLFSNFCRYMGLFFMAPLRNNVVRDIRNHIYSHILILPLSYFKTHKKGDIVSRISNDVQEIEWSVMSSLQMVFREPFLIILFIGTLLFISYSLTLFVLLLIPISGFLIARIARNLKKSAVRGQEKMGSLYAFVEESITGIRIIKAFNAIDSSIERFRKNNKLYTRIINTVFRRTDLSAPLTEFLGVLVMVIVIWIGGSMVIKSEGWITADLLIVFVTVFARLIPPVQAFINAIFSIQKGNVSARRVFEIIDAEEIIVEKPNAIQKKEFNERIEFKNVCFGYEDHLVLKNINFELLKGKSLAIVGNSGSGKTTLTNLLPRFYNCTSGEISIDNIAVNDLAINDLRGLMAIVSQENILFNDTVYSNISFGATHYSLEEVEEAARIANAHEFIMQMPEGYQTIIGDNGVKLSGGQKQRLSIARAVLRNPAILILDEATSSLDNESEKLVQDAISELMKNRTSIIIAHRLSTIINADEIMVLEKGNIVQTGNHNQLISQEGVYKNLYEKQLFFE